MFTVKKYVDIFSCTDASDLEKKLSRLSGSDAKHLLSGMISFIRDQHIDENDVIQFLQEQQFDPD